MILEKVEPYVVRVPEGNVGSKCFFFIRLVTDEGIYGWGETAVQVCLHDIPATYPVLIREVFEAHVQGRNPFDREYLSKHLYQLLSQRHPDLIMMGLISAFDIACWDICGKVANLPIYQLLGGKYRSSMRSYSYIYPPGDSTEPAVVAQEALRMVEHGFTAVKYDPVPMRNDNDSGMPIRPFQLSLATLRHVDATMAALRDAVGDNIDILVGTHGQMTTSSAIRLAKVLEPYNPLWFEEPVAQENTKEMAKVNRATTIPVSTGECLAGIFDFHRILEDGAAQILQPDLGACGGITEAKKIAALAETHYAEMAYHLWGGPVITAAALHLDTAIPNFLIQESIYDSNTGFFREILTEPIPWSDGYLLPIERPGLGIDFDCELLRRHSI